MTYMTTYHPPFDPDISVNVMNDFAFIHMTWTTEQSPKFWDKRLGQ